MSDLLYRSLGKRPPTRGRPPKPKRRLRSAVPHVKRRLRSAFPHVNRRRALFAVLGLLVLWILASIIVVVLGTLDASSGIADVQEAKADLSASQLVSQTALVPLRSASRDFASADGLFRSPLLAPFEVLPVLGRQLRSVRDLSEAAKRASDVGARAMEQVRSVLEAPHDAGAARVSTLVNLAGIAHSTDAELATLNPGPSALVWPLSSKRAAFVAQVADVRTKLAHAAAAARTTASILQGPQNYLLLMANPAEMRAGSGAFLEAGMLSTSDGQVHMTDLEPATALGLAPGEVTVGGDLQARWGSLALGQDWRSLGFTPQFDVNAPLAARMWEAATGEHVDGVIGVDVQALQQLLEVTGAVTLPDGSSVGAQNVVQLLTHDQYAGLTDSTSTSGPQAEAQAARQDELGALAHGVFNAIDSESLNLKSLAESMSGATGGRHLLLWSTSPTAESAWRQSGVAGELSSSSLLAAVVNTGGNKLDQYLGVTASLRISTATGRARATLEVDLANHTPPGQSQFIAGPYPGLPTTYGQYLGLLALNLPGGASDVKVRGNPTLAASGPEGPTFLVASPVNVLAGKTEKVIVNFTLPSLHGQLTVVPTARVQPVPWTFPGGRATDAVPFVVSW